ncbi:MAG: peptidylprolyl isomerase [Chloroflexi bacterium]|nr:peptidylprolyl isomerase [Chloroflexota bacterium]
MSIDPQKDYYAVLHTNQGNITVHLLPQEAPITVNNFLFLAREGFYDGVTFHRVVRGFVIQAGDPTGTGAGGPGYRFQDELPRHLDYARGTLAMANAGPNTNGSQFFITLVDLQGRLPKNYTIFGAVTDGMDVVDRIGAVPVAQGRSGEPSSPTVDVRIDRVTITE